MGPYKEVLGTGNQSVSLSSTSGLDGYGEFLEDIYVNDPEFNRWKADQSLLVEKTNPPPEIPVQGAAVPKVFSFLDAFDNDSRFFSALVADSIMRRLGEAASIETLESTDLGPNCEQLEFVLRTSAMRRGDHSGIRIRLECAASGAVIWTGQRVLRADSLAEVDTVEVRKLMNFAVDAAIDRYNQIRPSKSAESQSSALCFRAVSKMFTLIDDELLESERMLTMAGELDDRGIYHAWRAYLKIVQFGERIVTDREAVSDETQELIAHSLEQGADNSMVLALASYVQSVIFKNYLAASELAEQSLRISQINPLAWAFLGISKMHLGAVDDAFQCTSYARKISGHGPQKYQINMLACQSAIVAGRFVDAMELAELTVGMAPSYAPPKRYLAALLVNANRENDAIKVISDLKRLEPDFSFDQMTDPSYPASALRLSPLGDRLSDLSRRLT
ncbi:MAG: hypothetical protein ABJE99_11270 [Roseobacter sp.]